MKKKLIFVLTGLLALQSVSAEPMWIWKKGKINTEKAQFKKSFSLKSVPKKALIRATCDNEMTLVINGKKVEKSNAWEKPISLNVAKYLKKGTNQIVVHAFNEGNMAGFVFDLKLKGQEISSDKSWQARNPEDKSWTQAVELKKYGAAPWGKVFDKKSKAVAKDATPATMPIKTLPGFKVEKLYDVQKGSQGSWVGLTHDNKGRLIASDQYGGIYRITLSTPVKIEKLKVKTGSAHGVLYAFNSLYVFSGEGKTKGLYRLTDTNGDDQYDKEEYLIPFNSKGEHGVHSIVLTPDKKSLYLIGGNNTDLPKSVVNTRTSRNWKEDHILPRMDDGRGHNRGRLAPGGLVIKVSPDAKKQELIAHGFRNEFDGAFNAEGEFFVYDADMEYDIGSPWYRPTRVNHVVSGADFGWRHGTGKWPGYYTDTLPTTLDIGPGSPTGVTNGLGAKFPAKYQKAIFINDWTYGTMYAVHLEPNGATYKATREEFVSGKPLPLTDVIVHPDGNMYFMVGGRKTTSALYKVSYVGNESTAPITAQAISAEMKLRKELEKFHLDGSGEEAIAKAWPHLSHEDRYIRHAARVTIEKQPTAKWQNKFFAATNDWTIIEGATALARMGEATQLPKILKQLNKIDYKTASTGKFLAAIRSYQLAFARLGKADVETANAVIAKLNPFFPSKDNFINRELCQVLLYLNAPGAVSKTVQEMLTATEEQTKLLSDEILNRNDRYKAAAKKMEQFRPNIQQYSLAFSLRSIKEGWTKADHASYFSWFPRAKTWQGGNSFAIFIENSRKAALANVKDKAARKKYDDISSKSLVKPRAITPPKGPGQLWTVATAVKAVEKNLTGRNFKSGENLFHATACASCHRFAGAGSGIGPDLTGSANRYSIRDMFENIIEPSKVISDQYGSTQFIMKDGSQIVGRMGTEENGIVHLMTNPFSPESNVDVKLADVKVQKEWHVSPMPPGLVNSLNKDELSDLIAYIFSAGDANHKYFGAQQAAPIEGAQQLFNGKDLSGWKGDRSRWTVENGVIVGSTFGEKLKKNTFLIWEGEVGDFELQYDCKVEGQNNSGVMYRAEMLDSKIWRLKGNQADCHPKPEYCGMLYSEATGRGIVAQRGTKVVVDAGTGKPKITGRTEAATPVDIAQWNTYRIVAKGNRLMHYVNGRLAIDLTDNHKDMKLKGLIGLQIHAGKPMKAFFKNIQLKKF
jgi:putative heme-binding domain-containing protein